MIDKTLNVRFGGGKEITHSVVGYNKEQQGKPRIDFIDLAKGICIIMVVVHHIVPHFDVEYSAGPYLQMFRMPLYFLLSGLFFKEYDGFIGFLKRKLNKLLIPFTFFFITTNIIMPYLCYLVGYKVVSIDQYWQELSNTLCTGAMEYDTPIWFLWSLFFLNNIFYCIVSLVQRLSYKIPILIVASVLIGTIGLYVGELPWFLGTSLTALPFFCLGYVMRKYSKLLYHTHYNRYIPLILVVCFCVLYFSVCDVNYEHNIFSGAFKVYIGGISGTLFVLYFAKLVRSIPLISYWGKYSIMILCTHSLVIAIISDIVKNMGFDGWIAIAIVSSIILLSYLIGIPLMKMILPYVTAQKDVIKV